jgi:chromosome segregation ATPase
MSSTTSSNNNNSTIIIRTTRQRRWNDVNKKQLTASRRFAPDKKKTDYKRLTEELHPMTQQYEALQKQHKPNHPNRQSLAEQLEASVTVTVANKEDDKHGKLLEQERQMTQLQLQQAREALTTAQQENTCLAHNLDSALTKSTSLEQHHKNIKATLEDDDNKTSLEFSELKTALTAAKEETAALKLESATSFLQDNEQMISDQQELYQLRKKCTVISSQLLDISSDLICRLQ